MHSICGEDGFYSSVAGAFLAIACSPNGFFADACGASAVECECDFDRAWMIEAHDANRGKGIDRELCVI
jgi:hypothetical protein